MDDKNAQRAERLKELVNYQDDAVVSRTIIDKPNGTVTLFAFDKDEGLSEHTTPYDAMVQVLEGEVEIVIGGKLHELQEEMMIVMPAHVPHAFPMSRVESSSASAAVMKKAPSSLEKPVAGEPRN